MGLLSDPHSERGKLVKLICKLHIPLCAILYFGAIVWLCLLPHPNISMPIYFSENALLPGLVKTEFGQETLAKNYHDELMHEMKKYRETIPYPWLLAKFRQIGLDTYSHNFTLNYPLGKGKVNIQVVYIFNKLIVSARLLQVITYMGFYEQREQPVLKQLF